MLTHTRLVRFFRLVTWLAALACAAGAKASVSPGLGAMGNGCGGMWCWLLSLLA